MRGSPYAAIQCRMVARCSCRTNPQRIGPRRVCMPPEDAAPGSTPRAGPHCRAGNSECRAARRCRSRLGLVDVFAATLPMLKFNPGVHVNYAETVLPMRDGLPKFKDFPTEFGGSGEQIAE